MMPNKNGEEYRKMKSAVFNKRRLIADLLLALALLAVALSVFLLRRATAEEGRVVAVLVEGDCVAEYPLDRDGEYLLGGGTNLLVIEGGEAYIAEADCPDKLCVKSGKISLEGDRVVCLPNRVVIEIRGSGE